MLPNSKLTAVFQKRRHRRNVQVLLKYTVFVVSGYG
jgi:hypothetical protein